MNERIRELAEQAKAFIVESEHAKIVEVSEVSFSKYEDFEKFAELIVKQCIRLCDQVDIVGADECIDNIKEHFGVEE